MKYLKKMECLFTRFVSLFLYHSSNSNDIDRNFIYIFPE